MAVLPKGVANVRLLSHIYRKRSYRMLCCEGRGSNKAGRPEFQFLVIVDDSSKWN